MTPTMFRPVLIPLGMLAAGVLMLPACSSLNPLCGSSRPVPVLTSLSPSTVAFSKVQQSFVLNLNGSNFDASSIVFVNGNSVTPVVASHQLLQATITSKQITGPGATNVLVHTPAGTTGDLGCSSGGNSATLVLTVTNN
ncbi:MAG TPA: hypothetical protein VEI01_06700 [Terriglobales bacterium]|nr:hypothetical protein [Terriglobales bacterium]